MGIGVLENDRPVLRSDHAHAAPTERNTPGEELANIDFIGCGSVIRKIIGLVRRCARLRDSRSVLACGEYLGRGTDRLACYSSSRMLEQNARYFAGVVLSDTVGDASCT